MKHLNASQILAIDKNHIWHPYSSFVDPSPVYPVASAEGVVDWESLFDSGNGDFERAGQMDTKLASALLDLPFMDPSTPAFERSLAVRNLLRAQSFLVPSGEQVAECMVASGASEITAGDIAKVREAGAKLGLPKATPLWLYLLAEGRVIGRMDGEKSFSKGEGLGPGGRGDHRAAGAGSPLLPGLQPQLVTAGLGRQGG